MKLYKADGLTDYQKFHCKVFEAPKGSLSHWGVTKIEHYYRNERIIYHPALAHTVRRVIALAMPIFALLDAFHYVAISAYKMVTLQPKDSGYALLKCLKCLQLFLCTLPAVLIGVCEPKLLYRTDGMWLDVKKEQVRLQITKNFEKLCQEAEGNKEQVKFLNEALETAISEMVGNEQAIELLQEVLAKVISEIPTDDPDKQEIVIEQYIEMFSELLVCAENQNVELDKLTEHFSDMLALIITVRHPILRLSLIERLMTTAKNHPDIYEDIAVRDYEKFDQQAIPYLVARSITEDEEVLDRVLNVAKDRYFKNKTHLTDFIETLHDIYESTLGGQERETVLKLFLDSFELDGKIVNAKKSGRGKKGVPTSAEERDRLIAAKRKAIEEKTRKITGEEKYKRKEYKFKQQIAGLEKEIAVLEQMDLPSSAGRDALLEKDKGRNGHYLAAKDVLRMLLSITDRSLVSGCLAEIEEGEKYSHLSDEKIITDIFTEVFELEDVSADAFDKIRSLRAPWALVAFHSRVKGAKSKHREKLIEANKAVVMSLLDGTYNELRHAVEDNPTLAKVSGFDPTLLTKWQTPPQNLEVGALYPEASKRFKDYAVVDSCDPSDTLIIGNDMHTCVHLGGRIGRVMGLSAFTRDGKIHTILVKDDQGKTVGETQLILLWDEKQKKPVLFVEQANFIGAENNDYSVEHALYNYAKKRARDLGLELTTVYSMKDPEGKLMSKAYKGKVGSLGSSAPVEYVNRYYKNYSKAYDLGTTYLVDTTE